MPARLKVALAGLAQNRTTSDQGRRRESGFMSAGITSRGWCVWVAGQVNAEHLAQPDGRNQTRHGVPLSR
jgi:hypothetical protein